MKSTFISSLARAEVVSRPAAVARIFTAMLGAQAAICRACLIIGSASSFTTSAETGPWDIIANFLDSSLIIRCALFGHQAGISGNTADDSQFGRVPDLVNVGCVQKNTHLYLGRLDFSTPCNISQSWDNFDFIILSRNKNKSVGCDQSLVILSGAVRVALLRAVYP